METTARLELPLIEPGQAQKELFHNEALALLDAGVQACVVAAGVDAPPIAPGPGACWIVGGTPTGAWSGRARAIACWTAGGWRFVTAREGLTAWDAGRACAWRFIGGAWEAGIVRGERLVLAGEQLVGPRRPAIADAAGGAVIDAEARGAVATILATLRAHGLIAS